MKFDLNNAKKFGWNGLTGWAYNSKDDFADASAAYFEVTGSHGKTKSTHSDRIYYIIDGEGEFEVDDKKIKVKNSDVVIIPKNSFYNYTAINYSTLKLFLVHAPAFNEKYEVNK